MPGFPGDSRDNIMYVARQHNVCEEGWRCLREMWPRPALSSAMGQSFSDGTVASLKLATNSDAFQTKKWNKFLSP